MKKLYIKLLEKVREKDSEKGQSIVEVALTLPLVLLILCGIIDFGWIYSNVYKIDYAAAAGARYAYVHSEDAESGDYTAGIISAVNENLPEGATVTVNVDTNAQKVTINVTYPVRTLTFVASTAFGQYYNATASNTVAY